MSKKLSYFDSIFDSIFHWSCGVHLARPILWFRRSDAGSDTVQLNYSGSDVRTWKFGSELGCSDENGTANSQSTINNQHSTSTPNQKCTVHLQPPVKTHWTSILLLGSIMRAAIVEYTFACKVFFIIHTANKFKCSQIQIQARTTSANTQQAQFQGNS